MMTDLSTREDAPYFLEATVYSKDNAVVQIGEFCDGKTLKDGSKVKCSTNYINLWYKPFFYKHVETFIKKGEYEELLPIKHFYHRFTRSIFWELEDMIPFSPHWAYRLLWGWLGAPRVSLLKLFQGPVIRASSMYAHAVQESIMPVRYLAEGVEKFDNWFGIYPLLVFPVRVYDRGDKSGFLTPQKRNLKKGKDWGIWVDLGAYGVPRAIKEGKAWDAVREVREMEHWTRDIGGWQATYTDIFHTRKEFRDMFDHTLLDKARKRLNAQDAFPEVYSKVKPEAGLVDLSEYEEAEE